MEKKKRALWIYWVVAVSFIGFCLVVVGVAEDLRSDSDPFYQFDAMSDEDKLDWFEFSVVELRIMLYSDITVKQSHLDGMQNPYAPREELSPGDELRFRAFQKQLDELKAVYNSLVAKFNHRLQFVTWQNLTPEMQDRFDRLPVRYKPI